jgi:SAM-dependent methyltransferase
MSNTASSVNIPLPASYHKRSDCAFCGSHDLVSIMDFGRVALAGGFLKPPQFTSEETFPMELYFCQSCSMVQLLDIVDPAVLFKNYFYFSSAISSLREHFNDYATECVSRFLDPEHATVVEIGCNDGILLKPLANQGVHTVIGVDPATNILQTINDERITLVNDFFSTRVAEQIRQTHGKADMIVANNVYAHIPEIRDVTQGVKDLLKDDGVFVFEVHYLGKILGGLQYDMIYHEHLYYYSLIALINHFKRFDMVVFDVKPIPIHAGSMRYHVCHAKSRHAKQISSRVSALLDQELKAGYDKLETYVGFAKTINQRRDELMKLLTSLRREGKRVAGYGASGRANTIIQYCGITHDHMEYMIDDAPAKWGYCTPGSHFIIEPNSKLASDHPDYLLVFAWGYFQEIAAKCNPYLRAGGQMIAPLPDIRVTYVPTAN